MATRWNPTSTKYTAQMLQGGPSPGPTSFGTWTDTQLQQLRQAGVTMGDLQNLGLLGPPQMNTPVQNWTSGGGSGGSSGSTIGGQVINPGSQQQQEQNAILLKLIMQGQQGQQQPAQASQPPTWNQVGQAAGLSQADINQFQAMGRTPAAIAQQFNVPGLGQGVSPQQAQFQVPQQVVPQPVAGRPVVPVAQPGAQPVVPVKQFQSGGLVTSQSSAPANYYGTQYPLYAQNPQGNPMGQAIYANPLNLGNLLGAAALQMPPTINQALSGTPSSKSGVAPTPGALVGTSVPQVGWGTNEASWDQLAQAAGLSGSDISEFAKAGYTPAQVAQKFNVATPLGGPWLNPQIGSVFTPVARTAPTLAMGATPLQPAAQPTAAAYSPTATPFAQAPPAPGVQIPQTPLVMAHTSGLADAGKAIFAHFGGDPNSASPADIANFHNQLRNTITNYTAGATRGGPGVTALAAAQQPTAARKMQSGGPVPGRGDKDTVPALLTPGEYVIPKQQVQQLMRTGRLPIKMADGGTVPDNDPNAPPEARRKTLTTAAQTQSTPPPAAPGGGYSGASLVPGLATAAQAYSSSMASLPRNPIGSAGGGPDIRNTRLDPDPDIPYLKAAGMMGSGAGSGKPTANALSGIGSGLTQAAQAIASSVGPWQVQSYQQPFGSGVAPAPQVALQAPPAPSQTQQAVNPYAAYAMNQARYPTSPYYS